MKKPWNLFRGFLFLFMLCCAADLCCAVQLISGKAVSVKKKDLILILVLIAVSLAGLGLIRFLQKDPGASVTVTIDGKLYGTYPLQENQTIPVQTDLGSNTVVISEGFVTVEKADCPDKICVKHARISKNRETIICLPHKLVVEVQGGQESDIDVITR